MSRRKGRRAAGERGATARPERARGGAIAGKRTRSNRGVVAAFVMLAVLAVFVAFAAFGWWILRRGSAPSSEAPLVPVPSDSLAVATSAFDGATARHDWPEALYWQRRIVAALPGNPIALRQLAQTLHNYRNAVTLPDGSTRWLLRNSLERAEWQARAFALFDSSAVVSSSPTHRALARYWKGRIAEYEGLQLDALVEYEAALAITPQDTALRRFCDVRRQQFVQQK